MNDKKDILIIETGPDSVITFEDLLRRNRNAINYILSYGMFDGSHHKQWALDQALRALLEDEYEHYMEDFNSDEEFEKWDEGIPP